MYEAIIVKADLQSSCLLGPTWLSLAAARSDGQGWPKAIAKRLALDGHEHGGRLTLVRRRVVRTDDDNSEGSSLLGATIARILVFGRSVRIGTMMQSYASAAKPRGSGPILHRGLEAMEGHRVTATSDRHRLPLAWAAKVVVMLFCCSSFRLPSLTPPDAR